MPAIFLFAMLIFTSVAIGAYYDAPEPAVNSNYPYNLWVSVGRACIGEDIHIKVSTLGGPTAHANVALYSLGGARKLVSEVYTDASGRASFGPKAKGRYEVVAKSVNRKDGTAMFEVAECPVAVGAPNNPKNSYSKNPDMLVSTFTQNYFDGTSRLFEVYRPGEVGARKYTKVTIIYRPSETAEGKAIREIVPSSIASNRYMVGFESAYPAYLNETVPVAAVWKIGTVRAYGEVKITYVVEREITQVMIYDFAAPAIISEADVPSQAASNKTQKAEPKPAGSEAALISGDFPQIPLQAIGFIAVAVLIVFGAISLGQKK